MYNNDSELYNDCLETCFDEYKTLPNAKREELGNKYDPANLFLETYNYDPWFQNEELSDTTIKSGKEESIDLSDMPPLEGDEEVTERKGLKILTPNKLLTTLPILLAKIKAGNNSYKLKNEIRQILYLLYQHNKITKKVCNN